MTAHRQPMGLGRIGGTIQRGYQFVIDFHAGYPSSFRNRMVRYRRACGHHMLDVVLIRPIRGDGRRGDSSLRMTDKGHRFIRFDAGLPHCFGDHPRAVRLPAA